MTEYIPPEIGARTEVVGDCWVWQGPVDAKGYGLVSWRNLGTYSNGSARRVPVHRVVYFETHGPIPEELSIDHICRNRRCCRPSHLRLVTSKQNAENRSLSKTNKSGVAGIQWRENTNKWRVRIGHDGHRYALGDYVDFDEAQAVLGYAKNLVFTHHERCVVDKSLISPYGWGRLAEVLTTLGRMVYFD